MYLLELLLRALFAIWTLSTIGLVAGFAFICAHGTVAKRNKYTELPAISSPILTTQLVHFDEWSHARNRSFDGPKLLKLERPYEDFHQDPMALFVAWANVESFRGLIAKERDPAKLSALRGLLEGAERRLWILYPSRT